MLSPELKHFGRWKLNGIFQAGESKDSTVDFTDYSSKSPASSFGYVNSMLKFMNNHPYVSIAGILAISALSHLPVGRVGGVANGYPRSPSGGWQNCYYKARYKKFCPCYQGRQITKGPGTIVDVAAKSDHLKFESIAQTVAPGVVADTFPTTKLIQQLTEEGYFTGVGGRIFRNITKGKIKAIGAAARSGKRDEAIRLVESLRSSIRNAQGYRFLMDDLGLAVGKAHGDY